MIKDFKKELDFVCQNDRISDKLMIFSLYNEFYKFTVSFMGDYYAPVYAPLLGSTFKSVIASMDLQTNVNLDAQSFMKLYLNSLKESGLFSTGKNKKIILLFEKNLNKLIDGMKHVNVIDQYESIPLTSKVDIMVQFKEFINNMDVEVIKSHGIENSRELRYSISDMLLNKLDEYLRNSLEQGIDFNNISNDLKSVLMVSTKEYLLDKLNKGEYKFEDLIEAAIYDDLSELEQKLHLVTLIFFTAGYKKSEIKKGEICEILGISKTEFYKTGMHLLIRIFKEMKNTMKEENSQTIDDYSLKNNKKII